MNIDSALRMIDNEISNFGGQIKMQAGLMLPGSRRGDSTGRGGEVGGELGRWEGSWGGREGGESRGEGRRDKLVAKDCSDDGGCFEDVNNDRADSGRTGARSQFAVILINPNGNKKCHGFLQCLTHNVTFFETFKQPANMLKPI